MNEIDWDKILKGFDWVATDESGEVWAFKYRPNDGSCMWYSEDGKDEIRVCLTGDREEGSWRESLQHRPPKKLQPETDWKAKYEQLREHYAHLEDTLKAQECTYNVVVEHRNRLLDSNKRLKCELKETQLELNDVYKAQSKLNKIVRIVNELDEDDD